MGHAHSTDLASSHKYSRLSSKTLPLPKKDKELENGNTRHKRFIRFGTIRRKLAKSLKTGKHSDYRKHMRELLQKWPVKEIQDLLRQYEGLEAIKKLSILSDAAQPEISSLESDILSVLDNNVCTDLVIDYNGHLYSLHKGIVSCRCKFFAKYLSAFKQDNDVIKFEIPGLVLDEQTFSSLLRYIYTGQIYDYQLDGVLSELADKFGTLNELTHDLKTLLDSENHTDVVLVYLQEPRKTHNAPSFVSAFAGQSSLDTKLEVRCHSALLCARSVFFRSLIKRKLGERRNMKEDCRITINEKILPRCFARVVLTCIYTNEVDLTSVVKWRIAEDGTGEADRLLTIAELAMELYEIGQFLEIGVLSRGCELIILENINSSSLLGILEWSSQPHGSPFILRQAMQYFREEFIHLCKISTFLCNVPKRFLLAAIKSDYLQANEEFLLHSIIKWGEWQIAKAYGKSGNGSPGSSLPRRSPKRRECSNGQLREIISPLLQCVRLKHILPYSSSVLSMAFQRGLIDRHLPLDILTGENSATSFMYWLASCHHPEYQSPRLFNNYVTEIKMILHERLLTDHVDVDNALDLSNNLPDMLPRDHSYRRKRLVPRDSTEEGTFERRGSYVSHCQLDETLIRDMVLLEKELKRSPEALHVMSLVPDCKGLSEEIQLRVVRQFGLPDEMAVEVFGQGPDLVDSGSSSYSSKQNTLSRVGRILQEDENSSIRSHNRKTASLRSTKASTIASTIANAYYSLSRVETSSRSVGRIHGASLTRTDLNSESLNRNSYTHSPLDLPFRDGANSLTRDLPNVLMDT